MTDPRDIMALVMPRVSKILTLGEAALPRDQFLAFRKLVLDEFGRNGLEGELYELADGHHSNRNG